jgi:hypothetical protein
MKNQIGWSGGGTIFSVGASERKQKINMFAYIDQKLLHPQAHKL